MTKFDTSRFLGHGDIDYLLNHWALFSAWELWRVRCLQGEENIEFYVLLAPRPQFSNQMTFTLDIFIFFFYFKNYFRVWLKIGSMITIFGRGGWFFARGRAHYILGHFWYCSVGCCFILFNVFLPKGHIIDTLNPLPNIAYYID